MVGNPSLCIDSHERNTFELINSVEARILFVDLDTLQENLDISTFPSIELVIITGSGNYKITSNMKMVNISDLQNHSIVSDALKQIHEFEPIANTQTIFTYGSTSGSTGPPKIIVFPNNIPMALPKFENDMTPSLKALYQLIKWCGLREAIWFLKRRRFSEIPEFYTKFFIDVPNL